MNPSVPAVPSTGPVGWGDVGWNPPQGPQGFGSKTTNRGLARIVSQMVESVVDTQRA